MDQCCNPFNIKSHRSFVPVSAVNENMATKARDLGKRIKATDMICASCRQKVKNDHMQLTRSAGKEETSTSKGPSSTESPTTGEPPAKRRLTQETAALNLEDTIGSSTPSASEETSELSASNAVLDPKNIQDVKECTNKLLRALGLDSIDESKFRGKKYQTDLISNLVKRLNDVLFTKATPPDAGSQIIAQLKEKFDNETTDRNMKIKILTVLPREWSAGDIRREFGEDLSARMIYTAKNLVRDYGILSDTTKKIGRRIDENTVKRIKEFYYSDKISRSCPGIREYIMKRDKTGEKQKIQRRLVLMNLHEAYALFKEEYTEDKVGFSKFAALRPKECIVVGSAHGIHTTCVCSYHQNVKLIFDSSLKDKIPLFGRVESYRDLLRLLQCENSSDKCKLNECKKCPGAYGDTGIHERLTVGLEDENIDNVTYKQWINSVMGSRLETVTRPDHEFIDNFCEQLVHLNRHDFIAEKQSAYLKFSKEQLKDDEVIALLDFSENLSFEIQFQIQSYYYNKPQCTIHPICMYYKEGNELKTKSIIFIAESLQHNVNAVYLFQRKLIEYLRAARSSTKKIIFFSDGAASQYKNKKNFLNLCLFREDFSFEAEWHFFATSHGKSPCDALGGSFKRNARNRNMQNAMDPIDSAKKLYDWSQTIEKSKAEYKFCSQKEYDETEKMLRKRFNQEIRTVEGTQSLHEFKPIDESRISARSYSGANDSKIFDLL